MQFNLKKNWIVWSYRKQEKSVIMEIKLALLSFILLTKPFRIFVPGC